MVSACSLIRNDRRGTDDSKMLRKGKNHTWFSKPLLFKCTVSHASLSLYRIPFIFLHFCGSQCCSLFRSRLNHFNFGWTGRKFSTHMIPFRCDTWVTSYLKGWILVIRNWRRMSWKGCHLSFKGQKGKNMNIKIRSGPSRLCTLKCAICKKKKKKKREEISQQLLEGFS